ncbi:MAG: hypothetical protein JXR11_11920 [Balneola sp.]
MPRASKDKDNPLYRRLTETLRGIDEEYVEEIKQSPKFKFHNRNLNSDELDKSAREWLLIQELNICIPEFRLDILKNDSQLNRPVPYNHEALADLDITLDKLVDIQSFKLENNSLVRNGFAFSLLLPREQSNSQSWVFKSLLQFGSENVYLRPDPLMFDRKESFVIPEYKMWVYGTTYDWEVILNTKEEIHGKWRPDTLNSTTEFTEYVWSPRGDEVHFICEEIPKKEHINLRGSRYFHSIFSKKKKRIIHTDGAIRIFNESEWEDRKDSHLRKSGKIGSRIKVFLVDKEISLKQMTGLCSSYFVWNNDLRIYFAK